MNINVTSNVIHAISYNAKHWEVRKQGTDSFRLYTFKDGNEHYMGDTRDINLANDPVKWIEQVKSHNLEMAKQSRKAAQDMIDDANFFESFF